MTNKLLLDPVVIAQLGNLHLRARRILDGLYSGHHVNRNRGNSKEFSQHRAYIPGDDPKGLDWKIFGRTDRLVIKQYEEETNVIGTVIVDDSASMGVSYEGRISKLEYAKTLAAAFGYLLVSQHDAIGLLTPHDMLPPSAQRGYLEKYFETLTKIEPQGVWNIRSLIEKVNIPLKRKGIVMVFSDLMAEPEKVISTLRALHSQKHEVMVFHIMDPAEQNLSFEGPVLFEDSETGEILKTEPDVIRQNYQNIVKNWTTSLAHAFRQSGMDYLLLQTNTHFDKGLGSYLSWRGMFL